MATLSDGWIVLRPPKRRDAAAIADAVQASLTELEPWLPWASSAYDEAAALEWIAHPGEHPFVIDDGTGRVIGSSNSRGEYPRDRPLRPQDLVVTLYQKLGIDPGTSFIDRAGRPISIGSDGQAIAELL